eukprot:1750496-Pyramimonas_sp.AAC.1
MNPDGSYPPGLAPPSSTQSTPQQHQPQQHKQKRTSLEDLLATTKPLVRPQPAAPSAGGWPPMSAADVARCVPRKHHPRTAHSWVERCGHKRTNAHFLKRSAGESEGTLTLGRDTIVTLVTPRDLRA